MDAADRNWVEWLFPFALLGIVLFFLFRESLKKSRPSETGRKKIDAGYFFGVGLWVGIVLAKESTNPLIARTANAIGLGLILAAILYAIFQKMRRHR